MNIGRLKEMIKDLPNEMLIASSGPFGKALIANNESDFGITLLHSDWKHREKDKEYFVIPSLNFYPDPD